MNIEKQIVSLELAKKLNEFGVEQENAWEWRRDFYKNMHHFSDWKLWVAHDDNFSCGDSYETIAAFTVAELGEMLLKGSEGNIVYWEASHQADGWVLRTYELGELTDGGGEASFREDTEANARAKALIWLIESGHLNVKDL